MGRALTYFDTSLLFIGCSIEHPHVVAGKTGCHNAISIWTDIETVRIGIGVKHGDTLIEILRLPKC